MAFQSPEQKQHSFQSSAMSDVAGKQQRTMYQEGDFFFSKLLLNWY